MPQSSHEGMTPNAIPMDGVQSNAETAAAQRTRAQAQHLLTWWGGRWALAVFGL